MKTIFLVEGEKHVREALRLLLELESNFTIIGEDGMAETALAKICQNPPDVILLSWDLPSLHHPQRLISAIRLCAPNTIILAMGVKPEQAKIALKAGAESFLSKQLPPDEFLDALKKVAFQGN